MSLRIATCFAIVFLIAGCGGDSEQAPTPEPATSAGNASTDNGAEVLARGAGLAGANGLHFGPDGYLYVASVVGSDITVLQPDTGEVMRRYGAADGVVGPDDVAFAPDGSIYWTSILTGEVAGFTPAGDRVVAAQLAPGVNPITFSDDGRLFVAQCFLEDDVFEVDPTGENDPRVIVADLGPGCGLNGMDWGPDGRLYGPRWFHGEVVSLDVDDGSLRVEAEGLQVPAAVKFDSQGRLHVLDTAAGEVIRLDGDDKHTVATLEPGLDNFAFDAGDNVYVSSFADGFVKRIEPDGSTRVLQPGGMAHAGGIVARDNEVIVADLHALRRYDIDSGEQTGVQRNVVGVGKMGGAMNVAIDGDNFILTSWFDGDVRVWDPETSTRVAHYTDVIAPVSAVRYAGEIVVADHGTGSVVAFSEGGKRTLVDGLRAPTGLVVEQGDLYLSDRERGQILMLGSDGGVRETPLVVAEGLETPEGFVVTDRGFIVVEADPGRVVEINSEGARRPLADIAPGTQAASASQPPSQVFNGIAMSKDGRLFVPGETERVLYRIEP